jgi:hypothetical protein
VRALAFSSLVALLALAACGGGKPHANAADAPASSSSATSAPSPSADASASSPNASAPATKGIPQNCTSVDGPCVPDPAFVKRLCDATFPDVALTLMSQSSPFARMYLKGDIDGWNADGGASARARLMFDEEVLALRKRAPQAGGMSVGSGGASWLVMRWDGNCYTLDEGELSTKKPPSPKTSAIPWRLYEAPTKDALLKSQKVLAAYQKRGKECKGVVSGDVSRACEQADNTLSAAVVAEARGGIALPVPSRLP